MTDPRETGARRVPWAVVLLALLAGGAACGRSSNGGGGGGRTGTGGAPAADGGAGRGGTLDIYWIDVEGGAATLMVSPTGQSLLVDGGFPGNNDRDLNRVLAVLAEARVTQLDYVITTHYHVDHVGGVTALAGRFPVAQFIDHGASVEMGANYNNYAAAMNGKTRVTVKAGDRLPFGDVEILIVSAAGNLINALPTATANGACANAPQMAERPTDENAQSVGFIARFGTFDFVDLGDLTWAVEDRLACPTNRLGMIDLLQVSHHGLELSSSPQLVHGLAPLVAVMNNGASKGGVPMTWETLKSSPGLQDVWSLHRVTANDDAHNAVEALIANLTTSPDAANTVRASVGRDGQYTLVNTRNGETRTYRSR
jgi:competence protein ComEC